MGRPIAISLSPNTEQQDVFAALKMLFFPWQYQRGKYIVLLEQWFRRFFSVSRAVSFSSGRGALYAVLKACDIGKGDEVITQAFTCVALPNTIMAVGAKPVYADITDSFTINPKDVEKKITKQTKAIIAQHTFGIPSKLDTLSAIAKKNKLVLIEDCAHGIGGMYKEKKIGTFGGVAFFSFGRDKAFSSVWGGVAITNNNDIGKKLSLLWRQKDFPRVFWVLQQLLHPISFAIILQIYSLFSFGKILLILLQKLHLLSVPVSPREKNGHLEEDTIKKFPNALAYLALAQLDKLQHYNKKRIDFAQQYKNNLPTTFSSDTIETIPFLRFPFLVEKRDEVLRMFRKNGMYLGNWYSHVIDPRDVVLEKVYYAKGMCPNAESLAGKIINLPTYPTLTKEDVEKIIKLLQNYVRNKRNQ